MKQQVRTLTKEDFNVYKAKDNKNNEDRAIKIIDKITLRKQFYDENLYEMPEEDMISFEESLKNEIKYMIIMESKNK